MIRLAERHPDWVLGYQDEVWWSRLARPGLHAWAGGGPMRLHEPAPDASDTEPKALACYGLLRTALGTLYPRAGDVRPPRSRRRESAMIATSAALRTFVAHPLEPHAARHGVPAARPGPDAMAWARLVLRPEVLPRATLGQARLARRLVGA